MRTLYILENSRFIALSIIGSTRRESVRSAPPRPQCGEIVAAAFIAHSVHPALHFRLARHPLLARLPV
jgi:hypothetical protein